MYDLVGIERPCMDLNLIMSHIPEPDGGVVADGASWQGGGKVATGIVAAARLGTRCAMIGAAGDDYYGKFCKADFERHGVNTENFKIAEGCSTTLSVVLSAQKTHSRSFVIKYGTTEMPNLTEESIKLIQNSRYLFISGMNSAVKGAVDVARRSGAGVFIDADSYSEEMERAIPLVDIFVGSEYVYDELFKKSASVSRTDPAIEENCRKLMTVGPNIVIFTFGADGCAGVGPDGYFKVPAFDVPVVDTVGAGDVFHGAFIAGIIQGLSAEGSARYASGASAIKITRIGGRAGIPDHKTLQEFLDKGTIDYKEIDERVLFYERGIEHV